MEEEEEEEEVEPPREICLPLSLSVQKETLALALCVLLAILLWLYVFELRYIPSDSMYPAFQPADQFLVDTATKSLGRAYRRGDTVVFDPPPALLKLLPPGMETGQFVKRVVGVPNDTIEVSSQGTLHVNSKPYDRIPTGYTYGPVVCPAGSVFVLGDNRNESLDSHVWGFLDEKLIIGRGVWIYWPLRRLGRVGRGA